MPITLAFITNNAGDDIPGSTIKWTLSNYAKYFDDILVIDGRMTDQSKAFYKQFMNLRAIDSPWTGKHIDKYLERNKYTPIGNWILALDCDEIPSNQLLVHLRSLVVEAEQKNITIVGLPAKSYWCKYNSENFYPIDKPENVVNPSKWILYKNLPDSSFMTNKTGTHVTPIQRTGQRAAIRLPYLHMKSPETMTFNAAICLMDDLNPENEDPLAPLRGINYVEWQELNRIGRKYDILSKEKFRVITKNKQWPEELEALVRTFKRDHGYFAKSMYSIYYTFLEAGTDEYRLSYEEACNSIADFNENYLKNEQLILPFIVSHTSVLLSDITLPCGAG